MMCQRIGQPPISTIGLGRTLVSSARRVPSPPAKMTSFIAWLPVQGTQRVSPQPQDSFEHRAPRCGPRLTPFRANRTQRLRVTGSRWPPLSYRQHPTFEIRGNAEVCFHVAGHHCFYCSWHRICTPENCVLRTAEILRRLLFLLPRAALAWLRRPVLRTGICTNRPCGGGPPSAWSTGSTRWFCRN